MAPYGILAAIGHKSAVADLGLVHVWFLVGFRNRLSVFLDWIWSYVTYQRGARLITGSES